MLPQTRDQALLTIATLARRHNLDMSDIANAMTGQEASKPEKNVSQIIVRILSYIGGLMVFAGLGIYAGMEWKTLSSIERILITLGPGIITLVMAIACLRDARYTQAATPLLLISAIMQPTGLLVFLKEYFPPSPHPELAVGLVFLVLGVQQAALLTKYKRTLMALLAIAFGFTGVAAILYWLRADAALTGVVLSFAGLCLTQGIDKTEYKALTPWLFFAFGSSMIQSLFPLLSYSHLNWFYVLTGGTMAMAVVLQCLQTFTQARPYTLFFAIVPYLFFLLGALGQLHMPDSIALLLIGAAGCAVAYGLRESLQQAVTPALYLVFASMLSAGVFDMVRKTAFDPVMVGFGAGMMYLSVVLSSRTLLVVSVLSLLGFLTYFTEHYFAHVVGWPIALIGFGMVLILVSVYAVKLGRKITKSP